MKEITGVFEAEVSTALRRFFLSDMAKVSSFGMWGIALKQTL